MTIRESAKLARNNATGNLLTINASIYSTHVPTNDAANACINIFANTRLKASKVNMTGAGYSEDKMVAKELMAEDAAMKCGFAFLKFEQLGRHDLSAQMQISVTNYTQLADEKADALAQQVHDVMAGNISILTGYITAADLTALQNLINTYHGTAGTSELQHSISPQDTAAFKASVKDSDKAIDNLRIAAKFYKKTSPAFYNQLIMATTMPPTNVHHNGVEGVITNKSGQPVAGVSISIVGTNKVAQTDNDGYFVIKGIAPGTYTIEISTEGGDTQTKTIVILPGQIIEVDFTL